MTAVPEKFSYDDGPPRWFLCATLTWGVVGMAVGLLLALQMAVPGFLSSIEWLSFGRIRPVHTNAVIFAFGGNGFFAGAYYSTQRLLKTRTYSDLLSRVHFWSWQAVIVGAALTFPAGITQSKEYAELEWPLDILVAISWIVFAVNFFGTIARRRERHLYVALWFYLASIITVAILHIFNNLVLPIGLAESYPIYAGAQDAFMQWWYGHNAVAFFLTTPFLGLMYYFLPKAAGRPIFSYRLSILHFWSIVFLYIWAGPHHLHYQAIPAWASTLGMVFSLMLWMPSWGGMINGLLTLRGAWHRVAEDVVLKFFVVAITFYGMATFEGPLLSIKSVNALSHFTDWTIAHVHGGALGWNGFLIFGMAYWLAPRLFQAKLWSRRLAEVHFWIGTVGILLYIVALYSAGITQGLMWQAIDEAGRLQHPDFVETLVAILPMYAVRALGGSLYIAGTLLCAVNLFMTWRSRPARYEVPVVEALPLQPEEPPAPAATPAPHYPQGAAPLAAIGRLWRSLHDAPWHRRFEGLPLTFTVLVVVAVLVASLFEVIPTFLIKSNVPTIASVKPWTPLELYGRDIYVNEGCYTCHSQMVRPLEGDTKRYGEHSRAGEFVHDRPFQWGSRRIGPDLQRIGGKYPHLWHLRHLEDPRSFAAQSIMPSYAHLLANDIDFPSIQARVNAMVALGDDYGSVADDAPGAAREQARRVAEELVAQGGPTGLEQRDVVALIAYLQRLGTDLGKLPVLAEVAP